MITFVILNHILNNFSREFLDQLSLEVILLVGFVVKDTLAKCTAHDYKTMRHLALLKDFIMSGVSSGFLVKFLY